MHAWSAWEGAAGSHTVLFRWYKPNGSYYTEWEHQFTTTDELYYAWSWISTVYMYDSGQWSVRVHLDGNLKEILYFDFSTSASEMGDGATALPLGGVNGVDADLTGSENLSGLGQALWEKP